MQGYSIFSLMREAVSGHRRWPPAWRNPEPAGSYDVVIIGAGGHGLATAYYLAKKHGVRRVAVLEKGYLGGGNSGRNTQVCRSNYFWPESAAFYDHSLKLYEALGHELNFNIMLSQRGIMSLAHSDHELEQTRRWTNAIRVNGVDSEVLAPEDIKRIEPLINLDSRYPVVGGFIQRRGGIARHDAVGWGYARAANALGVDIIQQCEVTGFRIEGGRVVGVETTRVRAVVLVGGCLGVGASVALCGPIAFVGLLVPHLVRLVLIGQTRLYLFCCWLGGGAFLVLCDALAHWAVPGRELPVGVLTASLGAPALFLLIFRMRASLSHSD